MAGQHPAQPETQAAQLCGMSGFNLSPGFDEGLSTLLEMARIPGLPEGYAVFEPDLGKVEWYPDRQSAIEHDGVPARVPISREARPEATAALISGLVWVAEQARAMHEGLASEYLPEDLAIYKETERRALAHLFRQAELMPTDSPHRRHR